MKTFRHILSYLQAALLIGLTAACHDDIQSPNNSPDVDFATGITLRIPNLSRAADFARTRAEDPIPGANIIENEGKIHDNDLHLYIFPTEDNVNGRPIHVQLGDKNTIGDAYQNLPCLDENGNKIYAGIIATENNTETYYHIPMIPGKYKLYVLGNLKEYNENLVLDKNLTEDAIKGITLKFDGPLQAGHLPMLCLPEDVDGANNNGEFDVLQKDLTSLACNLRFQCAKVRYTVLFDNTENPEGHSFTNFGAHHFLDFTNGSTVSNIASGINLDTTKEYSENPLSGSEEITLTASEWPEGETFEKYNAVGTNYPGTGTNANHVATPGLNAHKNGWTDNDRRRAWQGIVYLPENKNENENARTTLHLAGLVDGTSDNPYEVKLIEGAKGDKTSTLDRGKFYDLTLLAKSRSSIDIETSVKISEWKNEIMGDFGHTWLIINKTKGKVESGVKDKIFYTSNSSNIIMGCDATIDDKPVIVQTEHDTANNLIYFTVNTAIPISEFKEGGAFPPHGFTTIWIEAGNHIRKYIDVEYSVEPYFEVTPLEAEIYWLENTESDPSYTRTFQFRTNLGGILGDGFSITSGNNVSYGSQINFGCANTDISSGTFTVTAQKNPGTSVDHYFTVKPKDSAYSSLAKEIKVTVKPPFGDYRIHFAVLNDGQGNGDEKVSDMICYNNDRAGYTDLWSYNGWRDDTWADNKTAAYLYMYTQIGETESGIIPTDMVWNFNGGWPGTETTLDTNNHGWYYWSFSSTTSQTTAKGTKYIKPGETLLMFNCNNGGYYRHRCPFHMDPGIQLFDFEDREGWIVYDPLCDPYYKIYDEKPQIDVVEYKVYSKSSISEWYINYGHSEANSTFTIGQKPGWSTSSFSTENGWNVVTIKAKAPRGDYAKAFNVNIGGNSVRIFGGQNYIESVGKAYGYYDNGKWYKGKPF